MRSVAIRKRCPGVSRSERCTTYRTSRPPTCVAEIYLRMGNREVAAFHYARFARQWSEADPELQPLVQQGRQALSKLAIATKTDPAK